ncbi:NAD(P)-binding oxidoreductase [Pontiella agarivorans]|uniref:SDR family oxidoreductase n=1 Tax=Pontiella agarivorans TaxID=3038953 RepID=A0ABU5MYT8_9BACT|nr:NAD(P)-binding oxidoreductase [Pontiella agarivorans]MDZ8119367.1 SDR family oxidoreductase [Pontiella agarivorans]
MKSVFVVGASGATGKLLVADLLAREFEVTVVVRSSSSLRGTFEGRSNYHEVTGSITEISDDELRPLLKGCDAVLSCLGHNLTFKGLFGKPRRLVADTVEKVCRVVEALTPDRKIKVILMNTTGNANRDIPERPPLSQRIVVSILRVLLPPHVDNEQAADILRTRIGRNHALIEWAVVRPDGLTDETEVSAYTLHPSPIRNAIFDAGQTSRINVANFMANLAADPTLWDTWKGQMPVIYNKA